MLTVFTWFNARRDRRALRDLVLPALTDRPTLLCVLSDSFRQADHLRPFAPLAEAFGDRLQVLLAAEWPQAQREEEGSRLLRELGLVQWAWPRLLLDRGFGRVGVVLREKKPVALIDLFFEERARLEGGPREQELRGMEAAIVRELERLLVRLAPQPKGPPQPAARVDPAAQALGGASGLVTRVVRSTPAERSNVWEPPREEARPAAPARAPGVRVETRLVVGPRSAPQGPPGVRVTSVTTTVSPRPPEREEPPERAPPRPAEKPKEEEFKRDRFELIELD